VGDVPGLTHTRRDNFTWAAGFRFMSTSKDAHFLHMGRLQLVLSGKEWSNVDTRCDVLFRAPAEGNHSQCVERWDQQQ
jgi:hypothetical protein